MNNAKRVPTHPAHVLFVETVRYRRTTLNSCGRTLHTLLALVVREGSWRFAALEPPRTRTRAPCTPCFPGKAVVHRRSGGSTVPNLLYLQLYRGNKTVRYRRTTPTSCGRTLYTLLALVVRQRTGRHSLTFHKLKHGRLATSRNSAQTLT